MTVSLPRRGDIEISVASMDEEVAEAVRILWPLVCAGQVGYPPVGQRSPADLARSWRIRSDRSGDELYIARQAGEIVGACGLWVSDDGEDAQTVCGPVAICDHRAVFATLMAAMQQRHPCARVIVGISHRHTVARSWLEGFATLVDHLLPFAGRDLTGAVQVYVYRSDEQGAFAETFDRLIGGKDMYWYSARVVEHWHEWICLAGEDGESILTARNYQHSTMSEVFATAAPDNDALRALLSTWIAVASAQGRREFVHFAEPSEAVVLESLGLRCEDEYLAYRVVPLA